MDNDSKVWINQFKQISKHKMPKRIREILECFLKNTWSILPNFHFMVFDRYWYHIPDFQDVIRWIVGMFGARLFQRLPHFGFPKFWYLETEHFQTTKSGVLHFYPETFYIISSFSTFVSKLSYFRDKIDISIGQNVQKLGFRPGWFFASPNLRSIKKGSPKTSDLLRDHLGRVQGWELVC